MAIIESRRRIALGRICSWICPAILLLLAACHDAPRKNPFDPQLTPPVELSVALDDTAGTAMLTWTSYTGEAEFAEYRVLRNVAKSTEVDTLEVFEEVEQATFVDYSLAPNTAYEYRVSVVNVGGLEMPSLVENTPGYTVSAIELLEVAVDEQVGQADLRWTRYTGPRFQAYQMERRSADEDDFVVIKRVESVDDTLFTDDSLQPDVAYTYRIVLVAAGQQWPSNRSSREQFTLAGVDLLPTDANAQEGSIHLTWAAYAGPEFQRYQVIRRQVGTDQEEELAAPNGRADTTFADGTALAGIDYLYTVVVQAAGQELGSNSREGRLVLPAVRLADPVFDSATGSVTVRWTPYAGPRFRAYQVLRSTAGQIPRVVAEIEDRSVASFVDTGLVGNTEYFYQVGVATTFDEEIASPPVSGRFHRLVATWPLEVDEGGYVRLYAEEEGRLTVLITERENSFVVRGEAQNANGLAVRLLVFDREGGLLEERVLYEEVVDDMAARSVATFATPDGGRLLSLGKLGNECDDYYEWGWKTVEVINYGPDGKYRWFPEPLVFEDFSSEWIIENEEAVGEIALTGGSFGGGFFDNVVVSSGGQVIFAEDFEDADLDGWELDFVMRQQNRLEPLMEVEDGKAYVQASDWTHAVDATWQNIRIEADVGIVKGGERGLHGGAAAIGLGSQLGPHEGGINRSRSLQLQSHCNQAHFFWSEKKKDERYSSGFFWEWRSHDELFEIFEGGGTAPYRLTLEVVDGQVSASVRSPVWFEMVEEDPVWTSLIAVGESILVNTGRQFYSITPEEHHALKVYLDSPVSEMRLWEPPETDSDVRPRIGVCLPEENLVLLSWLFLFSNGHFGSPFSLKRPSMGVGAGMEPGEFLFPMSLDMGPDGRVYVLDAGNGRIQVFDSDGNYITQWGHGGSGPGAFDFGSGRVSEDFAGSIAVDDDGFIYVADVGNRRIQKFSP